MPDLKHETPCSTAVCADLRKLFSVRAVGVIVAAHAARDRTGPPSSLIHRHSQHFAANVPQRLIDAGDGRAHHRTRAIEAVHIHRLPVMLHLHRIGADQEVAEVVDAGHHCAGFAFERAFAPADHALIGFEFHEDIGPVGIARQGNAEDFHAGDLEARLQIAKRLSR